jgi:putative endonuclease
MTEHIKLGKKGETIAVEYLIHNCYEILHRNFRSKFGEIDIISKKAGTIYFIEVKTRSNLRKGVPYEAIDYRKRLKLHTVATYFLMTNNYKNYKYTISAISIIFKNEAIYQLNFYPSIE